MKPATTLLHRILFGGLWLAAFYCMAGDASDSSQVIKPLVQSARLKSQAKKLDWLTNWPSETDIRSHSPKGREPSVKRSTAASDEKPSVTSRTTLEAALREAKYWIATVLQQEWVCSNLVEHLVPMQADDAKNSTVLCRYEVKGNTIQVIQKKTAMCIVVRPNSDILKNAACDTAKGKAVFERFFQKGEEMASTPAVEITEPGDATRVFVPDESKRSPSSAGNWWGWKAWYTDGDSVAVLLDKRSEDMQHIPNPDDLWF